jgi:putative endonuclease
MANKRNGTLYTGITSNLLQRVSQHKSKSIEGFTKKYSINMLVYYEYTTDPEAAIQREKTIKKWNRKWKLDLIEKENPEWKDLYNNLLEH